jgi:uracil-DNA glycosylase family 4
MTEFTTGHTPEPASSPHDELRLLTRHLRDFLDALHTWGVQHVSVDQPAPDPSSPRRSTVQTHQRSEPLQAREDTHRDPNHSPTSQNVQAIQPPSPPSLDPLARLSLVELESVAKQCTECRLHRGRTQVVFGVGNPQAELMFVGEAPGRDEDLQGEPFVGRAGQLLTRIIEAIGMQRQDVYIANVIKCRPPNNRNPEADEISHCEPYLIRQIALVKPRLIVALGTFAAQTLLKTKLPISQLRGRFHIYQGVRVMPTFHPAFLLRNPDRKRAVWEDMQAVQRELRQPSI